MNFNEYQKLANDLISEDGKKEPLLNGALGLAGESGEVADLLKKHLFQKHDLSEEKLIEELGDVLWYIAECCYGLNVPLEEIAKKNIEKLHHRYHGDKFQAKYSLNRSED